MVKTGTARGRGALGTSPWVTAVAVGVGAGLATGFDLLVTACAAAAAAAIAGAATLARGLQHGDPSETKVASRVGRPTPPSAPHEGGGGSGGDPHAGPVPAIFATRILLVEPDPAAATRLTGVLRGAHANVVLARTADDAMTAAQRAQAGTEDVLDVVIVAMHMARAIDTVAHLRAEDFDGPILGLTGSPDEPRSERCLAVGCSSLAASSITGEALILELGLLMRRHFVH